MGGGGGGGVEKKGGGGGGDGGCDKCIWTFFAGVLPILLSASLLFVIIATYLPGTSVNNKRKQEHTF